MGKAIGVPGLAALNTRGLAEVNSVSCGSSGNCAAGGDYFGKGGEQGFVAAERNGTWGKAAGVPGLRALNKGGGAEVTSVSCGAAGNCAAGGYYTDGSGGEHGFVAAGRHGVWGTAIGVPGLAALHKGGGDATVFSVSCAPAGNCAAGGTYHLGSHHQGFVADERNGRWGTAIEVPGLAALNTDRNAGVFSVSCASAGNCAAGGDYFRDGGEQGFVADERNDRWGTATGVIGLAALNKGGDAQVDSVSCGSAGNCAAGGYFRDGGEHGFVVAERNGRWGKTTGVPGLAALNTGRFAAVNSVSCASAGNCAAGGFYSGRRGGQAFTAVERNGRWGTATGVPGLAALNTGRNAVIASVSCAPAGTCAAGGSYLDRHNDFQGFVLNQTR